MTAWARRRRKPPACEVLTPPHAITYARLYLCGWRCARHTPAAMQGKPETPPGPGWPIHQQAEADPNPSEQEQPP